MIKLKNAGVNDCGVGISGVEFSSRIGCGGGGDSGNEVKNGVVLRVVVLLTVV